MDIQLQDSQKIPYAISEVDADGNIVPPGTGDSVALVSSDNASIQVVADSTIDTAKLPSGAVASNYLQTGFIEGRSKLQNGVTVTATITKGTGTAPAPAVDTFDVIAGPATTTSIAVGTPVSQ